MGFGLLFIGYFFTFIGALALPISQYTYVIGTGIILYSLKKLILENKMFKLTTDFMFADWKDAIAEYMKDYQK